ncbi:MAG TPA: hypothetical protein VF395_20045, partial [Polyangiaceae bacterium]
LAGAFVLGLGCSPSPGGAAAALDGSGGQPAGGQGGQAAGPTGGGAGHGGVTARGGAGGGTGLAGSGSASPSAGAGGHLTSSGGSGGSTQSQSDTGGGGPAGGTAGQCGTQILDPSTLPACTTCTGGRCVTTSDFPGAPVHLLDACGADSVCMPDNIVATKGNVQLAKCSSVSGAEGRCASSCIPVVRTLATILPQSTCNAEDRCVPCFNPSDGTETGICKVGCDPGASQAPVLFAKCCSDRGRCVPRAVIPKDAAANLPKESCSGADDPVCVPSKVIEDPTYEFPACTVNVPFANNTPGVCVPACIVDATRYAGLIGRGTCADTGDKCAPCTNPVDGTPSGACR